MRSSGPFNREARDPLVQFLFAQFLRTVIVLVKMDHLNQSGNVVATECE